MGGSRWTWRVTTKNSSILTERKRGNWLVGDSRIRGAAKYLGGITYLGGRATRSNSSFFDCWFHVEGVLDQGFPILWQEDTKIEKRFQNLMFVRPACAHS